MSTANDPWGRVDDDGTVYVRTAEGERVIGSWQAGSPEEALAFFRRKFEALDDRGRPARAADHHHRPVPGPGAGDHRAAAGSGDRRPRDRRPGRAAGPAGGADRQGRPPPEEVTRRPATRPAPRPGTSRSGSSPRPSGIAAEATHWKISGERLRQLLEEWKAAPRADRAVEAALWKRLSAARNAFTKRRKAYFAELEEERETSRARKEKLVTEAEALASSTDWAATAAAYRELMRSWKAAGRAARADEDELWKRFKTAQDTFFQARSEVYSAKDDRRCASTRRSRRSCWTRPSKLLPVTDVRAARAALRGSRSAGSRRARCPGEAP